MTEAVNGCYAISMASCYFSALKSSSAGIVYLIFDVHWYIIVLSLSIRISNFLSIEGSIIKTIETSMNEKECVIAVEGRIDTLTAPELEQSVMDNAQNSDKIILDMAGVEYISSAGLRVLLVAQKEMSKKEGFVLRNLNKNVQTILNLTGFNKVLVVEE